MKAILIKNLNDSFKNTKTKCEWFQQVDLITAWESSRGITECHGRWLPGAVCVWSGPENTKTDAFKDALQDYLGWDDDELPWNN